jgi:hypothetical protein
MILGCIATEHAGRNRGSFSMKKLMFAVVIAAIATSPALAAKKKAKRVAPAPVASASNNENSWRFVKDAFPVFLPSWSIPLYLQAKNQ